MGNQLPTTFTWITSDHILEEHKNIKINQVYVWVKTNDNKIIMVSKDGNKWQFPGGHPNTGESPEMTAIRELKEEAGLDISKSESSITFFGYYLVSEPNETGTTLVNILQLRYLISIPENSNELNLKPEENEEEPVEKRINFVRPLTIEEACKYTPWLAKTEELSTFKSHFNF